MRFSCFYLPAVATMVLLPVGTLLAQESQTVGSPTAGTAAAAAPAAQVYPTNDYADYDPIREFAVRVGWWGTKTTGSTVKTGEYQTLTPSSPFYDVDALLTDGTRTLNLNATGVEDGSTQVKGTYFGPNLEANLDYEQFPHALEHDPYANWATTASGPTKQNPTAPFVLQTHTDMNAGQDYAINVSELNLNLKGEINDGLRWRINVFSLEKSGERQQDATAHCYQDPTANPPNQLPGTTLVNQCHTVSQSQYIDWKTNQIEPALEAHNDWLTVEYSCTMRTFTQSDQMIVSDFDRSPSFGYGNNTPGSGFAGYGIVPDSITEINRLKTRVQVAQDTEAYVLTYVGDEKDELNYIDRHLGGVDGRLTNESIDGLTLTAHGKVYAEEHLASVGRAEHSLSHLGVVLPAAGERDEPRRRPLPADRPRRRPTSASRRGGGRSTTAKDRPGAGWRSSAATTTPKSAAPMPTTRPKFLPASPSFYQPDTDTNTFMVGVDEKWSEHFDTFARMKFINTAYPLYGVTPYVTNSLDNAVNTCLPTSETRMEIGGTWMPSECFLFNGTFYVEDASNHGPYTYFNSTNYPFLFSFMYAPTKCWHLNAGYANFDQNLTQNVNIGTPIAVRRALDLREQGERVQHRHDLQVVAEAHPQRQPRVRPRPGLGHQHARGPRRRRALRSRPVLGSSRTSNTGSPPASITSCGRTSPRSSATTTSTTGLCRRVRHRHGEHVPRGRQRDLLSGLRQVAASKSPSPSGRGLG